LNSQAQQRTADVLGALSTQAEIKQIDGLSMVLRSEFEKGVRAALLMTIDMPRAMIEHLENRREELRALLAFEADDNGGPH
jgi:hypothetical protein